MIFFQGMPKNQFYVFSNPLCVKKEVFSDNQSNVPICEINEYEINTFGLPFFDDEKNEERNSSVINEETCSLSSEQISNFLTVEYQKYEHMNNAKIECPTHISFDSEDISCGNGDKLCEEHEIFCSQLHFDKTEPTSGHDLHYSSIPKRKVSIESWSVGNFEKLDLQIFDRVSKPQLCGEAICDDEDGADIFGFDVKANIDGSKCQQQHGPFCFPVQLESQHLMNSDKKDEIQYHVEFGGGDSFSYDDKKFQIILDSQVHNSEEQMGNIGHNKWMKNINKFCQTDFNKKFRLDSKWCDENKVYDRGK